MVENVQQQKVNMIEDESPWMVVQKVRIGNKTMNSNGVNMKNMLIEDSMGKTGNGKAPTRAGSRTGA